MTTIDRGAALPALADTVWAERALVERLLYKLTSARLLLAADERRFVGAAMQEVEEVLDDLWSAEQRRTDALGQVAADWGVPVEELTLRRLADRAQEPWASMFDDHHGAFLALARDIDQAALDNRRLASAGLSALRRSMSELAGPTPETYDAAGRTITTRDPVRVDRVL